MRFVLLLLSITISTAWYDIVSIYLIYYIILKIHILIAVIAKSLMFDEDVIAYIDILNDFQGSNNAISPFEFSSVWLKHAECVDRREGSLCDGFTLLKDVHQTLIPFNPFGLVPNNWDDLIYFTPIERQHTAVYALSQSIENLAEASEASSFAKNIHLKTIMHLIGDIHQPFHVSSALCKWKEIENKHESHFFDADPHIQRFLGKKVATPSILDLGGRSVLLTEGKTCAKTLHDLWDSAGCLFKETVAEPIIDYNELLGDMAKRWLNEEAAVHQGQFDDLNIPSLWNTKEWTLKIKEWVLALHRSSAKTIYSEIIDTCNRNRDFKKDPYEPSKEYMEFVRQYSRKRIVLAGIRLAQILTAIMQERKSFYSYRRLLTCSKDEKSPFRKKKTIP